jgi:SAM-dependent methyltransferase
MSFKDHFSAQAKAYAHFRPTYPDELFEWLASVSPSRALAWDAATGNGQAALALAERFERVIATEPSPAQLANAERRPNVEYRSERAERSTLMNESVDLVTVAQALHWFDVPAFFSEVSRVLRPDGVLTVWCYELFESAPAIDAAVERYYRETVGAYWPPERRLIESGYSGLELPFAEIDVPAFGMSLAWTLDELIGYLGTWSATQRCAEALGQNPLVPLREELAAAWGDPNEARTMRWPLTVKACRQST